MISLILTAIAAAIAVAAIAVWLTHHISACALNALLSVSNLLNLVSNVIRHNTVMASWAAGVLAVTLWLWWKNGGGDNTRRRLRRWARKFQPVRRTAPAGT